MVLKYSTIYKLSRVRYADPYRIANRQYNGPRSGPYMARLSKHQAVSMDFNPPELLHPQYLVPRAKTEHKLMGLSRWRWARIG